MKKLINLCLILLLTLTAVLALSACSNGKVSYEITVDTKGLTQDTSNIKVCVYALDGSAVGEAQLTDGKACFELEADSYVATLSGLDETVSFSSALLTKNKKKATITLKNSDYDEFAEAYSFTFTVILCNGERRLDDLSALICDYFACRDVIFENGNVVDITLSCGECSVEVFDADKAEIYNEAFTLDLDARFYVIVLK